MRFLDFLSQYLDTFVRPFVRPNTAECYRRAFEAVPPPLAQIALADLDGMALQAMLNRKAAVHPRAAQLMYSCLRKAFAKAVDLGYLSRSPMAACVKPHHQPAKALVLNADQLTQYLQLARAEPSYPLLLIMATCGLRRGEALGLQWSCIDLQAGQLHVRQQRLRVHHGYSLQPLKSAASLRTLPLSPVLAAELARIRADQRAHTVSLFVCDTTPSALYKAHKRIVEAAGLPSVSLHGLRHSMATAAASQGCPMKILQGILGHSKYELTANLYADHLAPDTFRPHLEALSRSVLG